MSDPATILKRPGLNVRETDAINRRPGILAGSTVTGAVLYQHVKLHATLA
jgi:hypothetical protein